MQTISPDILLPAAHPAFELSDVTPEIFRHQVSGGARPVVLRGLVRDWPAVAAGLQSAGELCGYIDRLGNGREVETLFGPPEIGGRFFYSDDLRGLNFHRRSVPLGAALHGILSQPGSPNPATVYVQSIPVADHIPGFAQENALRLLGPGIGPRIWIGNRLTVQTHFDLSENIACCVAGRRRFTLFPPSQTPNLYPGPFELTLAGPPVSMVRLEAPDLETFPRFAEAMAHAITAELEPGDAIYIPYGWWHHVVSLEDFNVLVNYWWNPADAQSGSPFDAMLHALLAVRNLPADQREMWRGMFDTFVFERHGPQAHHLPEHARGALGQHTPEMRKRLWSTLAQAVTNHARRLLSDN